jgi:hypothetical protein
VKVVSIAESVDKWYVKWPNCGENAGIHLSYLSMPASDRKKWDVLLGDETGTIVLRAHEGE